MVGLWKALLKDMFIHYSVQQAGEKRHTMTLLKQKVLRLTNEARHGSTLVRAEPQLCCILDSEAHICLIRARVNYLEKGETSRRFAAAAEGSRSQSACILRLLRDDQSLAVTTVIMLQTVSSFL